MPPRIPRGGLSLSTLPIDFASRMKRAVEMGFDLDRLLFHGSAGRQFDAFNLSKLGSSTGTLTARQGIWTAIDPQAAEAYAKKAAERRGGNPWIMPLVHRVEPEKRTQLWLKGDESVGAVAERIAQAWDDGLESVLIHNFQTPAGKASFLVVRDPARLRSPQAQFDPAKIKSSNLLAGVAGAAATVGLSPEPSEAAESGAPNWWEAAPAVDDVLRQGTTTDPKWPGAAGAQAMPLAHPSGSVADESSVLNAVAPVPSFDERFGALSDETSFRGMRPQRGAAGADPAPKAEAQPLSFNDRFDALADQESFRAAQPAAKELPGYVRAGVDFHNQGLAASQRTTPNIDAHMPNLISAATHEDETGRLSYLDPKTGKVLPTQRNKHVVLQDPADGKLKVFARMADTDEGILSSLGRLLMSGMAPSRPVRSPANAGKLVKALTENPHVRRAARIIETTSQHPTMATQAQTMNPEAPQTDSPKSGSEQNISGSGYAMRALSDRMTVSQVEWLSEAIRSRSPLAGALAGFEEKASIYHSTRDPRAIGPLAFAARVLAPELNKAGMRVTTSELVKSVRALPEAGPNQFE